MEQSIVLDVYIAGIPEEDALAGVTPEERAEEIRATGNRKLKMQRLAAWKTLETAVERSFGKKLSELTVKKTETGKWTAEELCFSITHTDGAVAVAVSNAVCGVDMENLTVRHEKSPELPARMHDRVRTEAEKEADRNDSSAERFYTRWTRKEALFKAGDAKAFDAAALETTGNEDTLCTVLIGTAPEYILSAAGKDITGIRFFVSENDGVRPLMREERKEMTDL